MVGLSNGHGLLFPKKYWQQVNAYPQHAFSGISCFSRAATVAIKSHMAYRFIADCTGVYSLAIELQREPDAHPPMHLV